MNKTTSIVEVNGQRYDAVTGQLVGAVKKAARHVKMPASGLSLDGFRRKPAMPKSHAKRSSQTVQRKIQHSKTLMRAIVKRPATSRSHNTSSLKSRGDTPNYARAFRAKLTPKNDNVRRFGLLKSVSKKATKPESHKAAVGEIINPKSTSASKAETHGMALSTAIPNIATAPSHQHLERLLDYALARADAHKKGLKKSAQRPWHRIKIMPKWLSISAGILIVGALAGFFVWKNVPQIPLRLAASQAHMAASLPSYTPTGFIAGNIKNEQGTVSITYKNTTDSSKTYTVKEKPTNQDTSSTVANNSSPSSQIQTSQNNGVEVNIISDGKKRKAVCSNNGTQSMVDDNANLAPSELAKILASVCWTKNKEQ